jgi:hypothetical protein
MQIDVTPSNFAEVLRDNQQTGGSVRASCALGLALFALGDLLSVAHGGRGLTAALAGGLVPAAASLSPVVLTTTIAIVLDGLMLLAALGAMRGTRWAALYRRSLLETISRLRVAVTAPRSILSSAGRAAEITAWALALLIAAIVAVTLAAGGWFAIGIGSPLIAYPLLALLSVGVALAVAAIGGTLPLERFALAGGLVSAILSMIVLSLVGAPLAETLAKAGVDPHGGGVIALWAVGVFALAIGLTLFLAGEIDDESLTLILNWDSEPASVGPYFPYNPTLYRLSRRTLLKINAGGRQILLVANTIGETTHSVTQTASLSENTTIDLATTGFAIWDLKAAADSIVATDEYQRGDSHELVSIKVQAHAVPSTARLPSGMKIDETAFFYLKDFIFLSSTALTSRLKSAITTAIEDVTRTKLKDMDVDPAALTAGWSRDFTSLAFIQRANDLQAFNVLFRTPYHVEVAKKKEDEARKIKDRVDDEVAKLLALESKLKATESELPSVLQKRFIEAIDALLKDEPKLTPAEQDSIARVVGLFNVSATVEAVPAERLSALVQEAKELQNKMEIELKEGHAEIVTSQREVGDYIKILLAKPHLSPPERRFLEIWHPSPPSLPPPPSPRRLPPGGRSRF